MKRILSAIACAVFHKGTAIVYRFAARQAVGLPVLAIGNLTWGGAGKTPTALAFAAGLARTGEHPAIVSRGYKRRLRGTVAVDPARHNAGDVGDEPLMMARRGITVFVDVSRKDGAAQAQNGGATCLLLDDGIQNPRLKADFTLVVVDGGVGIDTGQIVPIRLPLSVLAGEVDAVLLIGDGAPGEAVAAEATRRGLPVFRSAYAAGALIGPEGTTLPPPGAEVFAYCGIGRPAKFEQSLREAGYTLAGSRHFADHHRFTAAEARSLLAEAGERPLVTTEKDATRLLGEREPALAALLARSFVLPVELPLPPELFALVQEAFASRRSR